jgi:autotransporter-associated beta strand protein
VIDSVDPLTLPLFAVAAWAAAMYPIGLMFGAECSLCCDGCIKCEGPTCCGEEWPRAVGTCCGGEWRTEEGTCCDDEWYTEVGTCCGDEWHTDAGECCGDEWQTGDGECCDGAWRTGDGVCCKTDTVPVEFSSDFGTNAAAKIIWDGADAIEAVLQNGGTGYAVSVDDAVQVASLTAGVNSLYVDPSTATPPTLSATIDDDPDSPTFGKVTEISLTTNGDNYEAWEWFLARHWFPQDSNGDCCKAVWYPEESCPEGEVFVKNSETCCGCFPDTVYDPESQEMVPTLDNLTLVECPGCDLDNFPYTRFDEFGNDLGPIGRCCLDGECSYTREDDCEGVWSELCCSDIPGCDVPCCAETSSGVASCSVIPENECEPPSFATVGSGCGAGCSGACCVDGEIVGTLTQEDCDEAGGCWAGVGQESCRDTDECRPPFSTNCCESVVSGASGLTFTQPRRKRCDNTNTTWIASVTGTTDSPVLIHGVLVGVDATPSKRCPINVSFGICWDKFNIEPVPCDSSFKRLDVSVCWTPSAVSSESLAYSGCNDITVWLGDCSRDCETTMTYDGPDVTSTATFQIRGDATIEANGGAMVLPGFSYDAACDLTLTLTGTSTAGNAVGSMANPSSSFTQSLKKTGTGRWKLTAASTFTGLTEILSGTMIVATNAPLDGNGAFGYSLNGGLGGGSSPVVEMAGGATLLLDSGAQVGRIIDISGGSGPATLGGANTSGTTRFQSAMTFFVNQDVLIQAANGGTVEFANGWLGGNPGDAGPVESDFTFGSDGNTGTVLLSGNLSTTGEARVEYGTLRVTGSIAAGGVTIDGSGTELDYRSDEALASPVSLVQGTLTGDATINTVAATGGTISVGSGEEIVIDTELSGSGTVEKTGAGTLLISGVNTFAGTLNVSAGNVSVQQIPTNPDGLVTDATFTSTTLSVAFTADPTTGAQYVLLAGPTTQTYTGAVTLTGTSKTGTYNATTSTLTIT